MHADDTSIIPTSESHRSTSSQATGPSHAQGSRYRNNPGIGIIPISMGRVAMAQISRQLRQAAFDVGTLGIPADEGRYGKAMT